MAYRNAPKKKETILRAPAMVQIYQNAHLLAYNQASVLIYGESGVGKSHLADYIQQNGPLANYPYIRISCNAISEELFASELFGYSPNAFTGASAKGKVGLLEAADHGTVLFDEINELPPQNQTLLLHFLQNKNITPIGSLMSKDIHTRIICTSGRDLREMIREGSFRSDLYYRIRVANIYIPPVRERREEIPFFLGYFMERYANEYGCPPEKLLISDEQTAALSQLQWRGNIREIANLAQQICLSEDSHEAIEGYLESQKETNRQNVQTAGEAAAGGTSRHGAADEIPFHGTSVSKPFPAGPVSFRTLKPAEAPSLPASGSIRPLKEAMQEFERSYIQNALEQTRTLKEAADVLGISFSSLCRKKAELGIKKMQH